MSQQYPLDWNHDAEFPDRLVRLIGEADCGWLQAVTQLGFVLAAIMVVCEDEDYRVGVAEVMAAKLLEAARTGRIPGEVMQ